MADDCVTVFNEMKLKHTMKYIVYKMNDGMTEIQVPASRTLIVKVISDAQFQVVRGFRSDRIYVVHLLHFLAVVISEGSIFRSDLPTRFSRPVTKLPRTKSS